ncbi:uncharacterized protein Bfra_007096 [Botrytis fragariae]|uniref:Uncharacterized protein n=1 Tax=Botrytis fragariae TaxID=1964551 RepID=A0A8H6ED65_9HELO|nr:uncharacterized protein Bfra_007096 [Botrytis fragariae]KAF5867901.1 hypothetical protein Bfra_007096 [Botrytis fragariae]
MCTTYFSTYINCNHRPFRRTRCPLYNQDPRACTRKVEVLTDEGLLCPECFDQVVWVRSNNEWDVVETPDGDLAKDDWVEVVRVGYDWREESELKNAKARVKRDKAPVLSKVDGTKPVSKATTENSNQQWEETLGEHALPLAGRSEEVKSDSRRLSNSTQSLPKFSKWSNE